MGLVTQLLFLKILRKRFLLFYESLVFRRSFKSNFTIRRDPTTTLKIKIKVHLIFCFNAILWYKSIWLTWNPREDDYNSYWLWNCNLNFDCISKWMEMDEGEWGYRTRSGFYRITAMIYTKIVEIKVLLVFNVIFLKNSRY